MIDREARRDAIKTRAVNEHFANRPLLEQALLERNVVELRKLEQVGRTTALEILWAVGRMMGERDR